MAGLSVSPVPVLCRPRPVAPPWLRAGSPLAPSISTRLMSGRRGKGHKTFIALENRQGNVCLS